MNIIPTLNTITQEFKLNFTTPQRTQTTITTAIISPQEIQLPITIPHTATRKQILQTIAHTLDQYDIEQTFRTQWNTRTSPILMLEQCSNTAEWCLQTATIIHKELGQPTMQELGTRQILDNIATQNKLTITHPHLNPDGTLTSLIQTPYHTNTPLTIPIDGTRETTVKAITQALNNYNPDEALIHVLKTHAEHEWASLHITSLAAVFIKTQEWLSAKAFHIKRMNLTYFQDDNQ